MNRQQRREAARAAKRSGSEEMEEKLLMLNKLKDKCRVCEKSFDKTDTKMISEWTVVVRESEQKVHLYCPGCWDKAQSIVKEFASEQDEEK